MNVAPQSFRVLNGQNQLAIYEVIGVTQEHDRADKVLMTEFIQSTTVTAAQAEWERIKSVVDCCCYVQVHSVKRISRFSTALENEQNQAAADARLADELNL